MQRTRTSRPLRPSQQCRKSCEMRVVPRRVDDGYSKPGTPMLSALVRCMIQIGTLVQFPLPLLALRITFRTRFISVLHTFHALTVPILRLRLHAVAVEGQEKLGVLLRSL